MLNIILDSQPNPLAPIISLLGFAIAMILFFSRKNKDEDKEKEDGEWKIHNSNDCGRRNKVAYRLERT